jgi:hypothetical protein
MNIAYHLGQLFVIAALFGGGWCIVILAEKLNGPHTTYRILKIFGLGLFTLILGWNTIGVALMALISIAKGDVSGAICSVGLHTDAFFRL